MLRTRPSRSCLAALAVAALAFGALAASDIASASPRIDPGFGNGPARIDPGFGRGPARINPVFTKHDGGPKYTVGRFGDFQVRKNCRWDRIYNSHYRPFLVKVCD